jgi:ATP-dependent DNA helicase RecQ
MARGTVVVRTAEACAAIGRSPVELDRLFAGRPDLLAREGPRGVCLELLPVKGDAASTLTTLLDRSKADAERRIRQVMGYVKGRRCRHVVLAAHLGEQLEPCGTSCDVCTGAVAEASARTAPADTATPTRTTVTAQDAVAVIKAVRTLPFPMGKTGLAKLLTGSVESRVRADRSPSFGTLVGLTRSRVEGLIDRLVADGFLNRDLDHEYKLVTVSERGAGASPDDFAGYEAPVVATARPHATSKSRLPDVEETDLTDGDQALLERLYTWRRERASTDAVPPYVVAHNSMLRNLAITRPTTPAALGSVPGFGPSRVERYGPELLRLIASAPPD